MPEYPFAAGDKKTKTSCKSCQRKKQNRIPSMLKSSKYKDIVLISSDYHTKRIKISFDHFLKDQDIKKYTYGSGEKILLRHAIVEFIKLKVYQYFLI